MSSWWSKERIEATVNPEFITRKLPARYRSQLRSTLSFGQGLTDGTYLDWILAKGPRLFLILDDIGCPEHIFEFVDKSYDDSDLPLSNDAIADLRLANRSLEKKFAKRQYAYNVQELWEGLHVDYLDDDYVPVEVAPKAKGAATSGKVDRVIVRNRNFAQRSMCIDEGSGIDKVHLVLHFRILQKLKHPHLVSVWATYIHRNEGFLLLQPSLDLTLKSFLDDPPKSFKQLPRTEQCELVLQWIRCLADALSFLHQSGYSHQAIRPSNIFIDPNHHIYLGAYQALGALEDQEPAYVKDTYEHAAPEQWQRTPTLAETNPLRSTLQGGGRTGQRIRGQRSSSTSSSSHSSRSLKAQIAATTASETSSIVAATVGTATRNGSVSGPSSIGAVPTSPRSGTGSGNGSGGSGSNGRSSGGPNRSAKHLSGLPSPGLDLAAMSSNACRPSHTIVNTLEFKSPEPTRDLYDQSPYLRCDVFSMSAVFIEVLSLLASIAHQTSKFSPSSLRSHLGKHNRTAGRGGAPADSSFHANLRQTNLWLDVLSQSDSVSTNKLTSVFRKTSDKGKTPQHEGENWRCKGALSSLSDLLRPNVCREPRQRYTALETVLHIDSIYERWGISKPRCCQGVNRSPSSQANARESMITALQVPRSATASSVGSKWSARPGRTSRGMGGRDHRRSASTTLALRPEDVLEDEEAPPPTTTKRVPDDPDRDGFAAGDEEDSDDSDAESLVLPIDELAWPSPHSSRPATSHFAGSGSGSGAADDATASFLRSSSTLLAPHPDATAFLGSQSTLQSLPPPDANAARPRRSPSALSHHRSPPPSIRLPPTPTGAPSHHYHHRDASYHSQRPHPHHHHHARWPARLDSHPKAPGSSSGGEASSSAGSASASGGSAASSASSTPAPSSVGGGVALDDDETFRPFWRETRFAAAGADAPRERRGGTRRRGMMPMRPATEHGGAKRFSTGAGDDVPPVPTRAPGHAAPRVY